MRLKILILGVDGMIGNGLAKGLMGKYDVTGTTNAHLDTETRPNALLYKYYDIDALNIENLSIIISDLKPDIVINAIGIVKQKMTARDEVRTLELNAVLPYRLLRLAEIFNFKLILLSTDCVFSGQKGNYIETDLPDATDFYGRSKMMGEISVDSRVLTLRVSTIGLELRSQKGLIEWFLQQKGRIHGFTKAIYTGFTSLELSRIISLILEKHPNLYGLYHVSSEPISKYDLLQMLKALIHRDDVEIISDDSFSCDRSLNSERFSRETGYLAPTWNHMLAELAQEITNRRSFKNG